MRIYILFVALLASPLALAADQSIIGVWDGADKAAMSIYGTLKISAKTLSWDAHSKYYPACKTTYEVIPEGLGVEFQDQIGRTYKTSADSKFKTYLLKIDSKKCTNGISHFRLTITEEEPNDLAMIELQGLSQPAGWIHFSKH